MIKFVNFLLSNVYSSIEIDEEIVNLAFEKTILDVKYNFPDLDKNKKKKRKKIKKKK